MDLPRRAIPSVAGLLAFEATARYLSFSRAAEDLCLSQGAVSKRVRQLEQVVGVPLLARTRHQVHLTEMGRIYLRRVRKLLEELESTTQALRSEAKGRESIVLAAPLSFSLRWLMPRFRRYREGHPDIRIDVVTVGEQTTLDIQPGIDCLVHGGRVKGGDALHYPLFDLHWVAVASPAYRDRCKIRIPADIGRVARVRQSGMQELWASWAAQAGISPGPDDRAQQVDGLELAIAAATAGNGVAIAPRRLIEPELDGHELAILFDDIQVVEKGYHLSIPARLDGDDALADFVAWICREAAEPARTVQAA